MIGPTPADTTPFKSTMSHSISVPSHGSLSAIARYWNTSAKILYHSRLLIPESYARADRSCEHRRGRPEEDDRLLPRPPRPEGYQGGHHHRPLDRPGRRPGESA